MTKYRRIAVVAGLALAPVLAFAAEAPTARNVILMISDGCGFNGWLAADYFEGRAGTQPYQVARPDGTRPYVGASAHYALRLFGPDGEVLDNDQWDAASGVEEQGYVPRDRWTRLEGAFSNDFGEVSLHYTSYTDSGAAGTALHSGRKTSPGRINMNWDGTEEFQTIAHIAHGQGRATGAVTTVPVSHATPGSVWAQVSHRDRYAEIFRQMADGRLDVIMGAGHPFYDNSGQPSAALQNRDSESADGRKAVDPSAAEADRQQQDYLEEYESGEWPPAEPPDRDFAIRRWPGDLGGPDQREGPERLRLHRGARGFRGARQGTNGSARKARRRLSLAIRHAGLPDGSSRRPLHPVRHGVQSRCPRPGHDESGRPQRPEPGPRGLLHHDRGRRVDWMGHANYMPRFIEEQIDFSDAVAAVIDWVETHSSWDETLLIVTSDHETGGIWGEGTYETASGLKHPTNPLDANSRNATQFVPGRDRFIEFRVVQDRGAGRIPDHQFASGEHTNDLVPLWALGAGSTLFRQFERHDAFARTLWGEPYGWVGNYVDNTAVFRVMNAVFANAPTSTPGLRRQGSGADEVNNSRN